MAAAEPQAPAQPSCTGDLGTWCLHRELCACPPDLEMSGELPPPPEELHSQLCAADVPPGVSMTESGAPELVLLQPVVEAGG